jgi:hypothetical protein
VAELSVVQEPGLEPIKPPITGTSAPTGGITSKKTAGQPRRFAHGHVGTAWLGPQVGVITTVLLSAFNYDAATATIMGALAWLISWLISGFVYAPFTSPDRANPRNFGELVNRLATLEAERDELCVAVPAPNQAPSACAEAKTHLDWVKAQTTLGGEMRWVNGAGYISIWQRLHRAEEALIGAVPAARLGDEALHDELRLKDSSIPNRDDLMAILRTVKNFLCDGKVDTSADPCVKSAGDTAAALKEVRFSINDFRDSSWNGLLQLRNQTMGTLLVTNTILFAIACAAVIGGAKGTSILAAAVFYLVGAAIGLFNRLYQQFQANSAIEDYGLTSARLVALPVYSGLAAVAGVLITVLAGATTGTKTPELTSVFMIPPGVGLLVVAAAFGAAPDLVLKRLSDAADKFKTGIASTETANRT